MAVATSGIKSMRLFACVIAAGCIALLAACGGVGSNNATMQSIEVTPANAHIAAGTTTQLTATAIFSDSSRKDVTARVTWSSSNSAAATISNTAGLNGLATGAAVGSSTVSATAGGVTGQATLMVTPAVLVSIEVTPPGTGIAKGTTTQFSATGVFSDKTTQDLTAQVTWSSSNPAVGTISNMGGGWNGRALAATAGTTAITATLNGVSSSTVNLTVSAATLVSIQVTPSSVVIARGLTEQFVATGTFTDGSTQNLTSAVSWSSSTPAVATISDAAGSNGLASTATVGNTSISASLNGITSLAAALTVSPATLVSIQVTPPSASIANGLTEQFAATGVYTDGSTQNLTSSATWSSSNAAVGTISNAAGSNGLATSAGVGSTNISASMSGITSPHVALTVTAATLVSIQVTPPSASIPKGLTEQFTATGVYTDGTKHNLTSSVTWSSSNATAATVSNASGSNGLATAAGTGSTYISASFGGVTSPNATLAVTAATLVSIQVTPPSTTIANGLTAQLTATGTYTDGSTQNLTSAVTWSSSNTGVATISSALGSNGLASTVTAGTTNVTASFNGVTSSAATLTVTAATLVSIQVTPPAPSLATGLSEQFIAMGTYTDSSTQNLTSVVTWSSTNTGVATVSNAAGSNGLASAATAGTSNISASLDGISSPNSVLTVTPATLVSIQVTPPSASIPNGLTESFTATGIYSDGSTQNLTNLAAWSSSNTAVATVGNAPGSSGLASAAGLGSTNISASFNGVTSSNAALTVTAATLVSIHVAAQSSSIASGLTAQFTAIGVYSDNSTQNLTSAVTWSSSNTGTAAISNAAGSNGLASALAVGTTSIWASLGAVTSPSATLTVTAATLVSLQVTPSSASTPNGLTQQFAATGTYTDNSTQDLTTMVAWSSTNPLVASISNAPGSNGLASALGLGTTSISASFDGVTSTGAPLTVSAATLVSIQVTPANPTVADGATLQFVATGVYSDGTQVNLTSAVTWLSTDGTVASISNASGSNGLATGGGAGTSGISATFDGVTSPTTTLTVTANFAGVWISTNQAILIMDNSGNLTAFGLLSGAWVGYSGKVQINGGLASGMVAYNYPATHGQGACESCSDQIGGLEPSASVSVTLNDATTVTLTDSTNNITFVLTAYSSPGDPPITDLASAQASWNTLQGGGEPSYPTYGGYGNPYPQVNNFACGAPPSGLTIGGTMSADVPALGIYILTCANATYSSPVAPASGLVFMTSSGQIFGAYANQYVFTNVSYPAGVIP